MATAVLQNVVFVDFGEELADLARTKTSVTTEGADRRNLACSRPARHRLGVHAKHRGHLGWREQCFVVVGLSVLCCHGGPLSGGERVAGENWNACNRTLGGETRCQRIPAHSSAYATEWRGMDTKILSPNYTPHMARVIAVANQKGGVAKTTTTHTVGVALARLGARVLLVDLDPQGCLTFSLGLDPDTLALSMHDVLTGRNKADDIIVQLDDVSLLPTNIELAGAEMQLLTRTGREYTLARALSSVDDRFDYILIDCAPTLGVLTVNGLTAAQEVLIPLQCEALSHRGVAQLLDTINDVREFTNPKLTVRGAVATMFDGRTRHAREVIEDVRERFGIEVLDPPIPKSIRFAEAPSQGVTILDHAPTSPGALAYQAIAATLHADIR